VNGSSEGLWQAQLFSNPPEDALLLVGLKILDCFHNSPDRFEIIFRGTHEIL
jgi:hypothetical protein